MPITSTLSINDRMTGALNRISAALNSTIVSFERLDTATTDAFDVAPANAIVREMDVYQSRVDALKEELLQANNRLTQMEANTRKNTDAAASLRRAFGAVAAVVGTIGGIKGLVNLSDDITQTTARLDQMNQNFEKAGKTSLDTEKTIQAIFQNAQNARGSFSDMAAVIARFGNNAGDAFSGTEEVIAFANLVQKQMTIAGASTDEASNAMLQLSQALGSGVLRGDELNSIFEQAPNLIRTIADYLEVPIGDIRAMASEGKLTADIVKNAILNSADDINEKFEAMPLTWGQVWENMKNRALMVFRPILQRINDLANSPGIQTLANGLINALANLANWIINIADLAGQAAIFISDNWSTIAPIIGGIVAAIIAYNAITLISAGITAAFAAAQGIAGTAQAIFAAGTAIATGAQLSLNAALYACPITWIVAAVLLAAVAIAAVLIFIGQKIADITGIATSGLGVVTGALFTAAAFIGNLFVALANRIIDLIAIQWNFIAAFANFFANVFNDPIGSIVRLFADMADNILSMLQSLASAIDTIFGSNLAGAVSGWRDGLSGMVEETYGKGEEVMAKIDSSTMHLGRFEYKGAWDAGVKAGDGIASALDSFSFDDLLGGLGSGEGAGFDGAGFGGSALEDIAGNTEDTAGSAKDIKDAVDISNENLEWMRDLAEQEAINRFTTAEVNVTMGGVTQNVSQGSDANSIIAYLASGVGDALQQAADGVHV